MVSSAAGEKIRKRFIPTIGRIRPPELSNILLMLMVSQRTEQNWVCRVLFETSLKDKLSARSAVVEGSV